ncbi:MAG TPA: winged helix-turn-helix domain-containing protein [Edaphobacter sp.]|nr:winged helix-turn-helix domain-containing protein [Edaphobacter sp.]
MTADRVQFEGYELDLRAYRLRRADRSLKLERIPMEILFLLVERRGQLVTREDIIAKLWGTDVFIDTDNAINTAIRKIRMVLRDDPEKPRFIQTISGRGYRFVAKVSEVEDPLAIEVRVAVERPIDGERTGLRTNAAPSVDSGRLETTAERTQSTVAPEHAIVSGGIHRGSVIVLVTIAVLALTSASYLLFHRRHKLTDSDTVVLADFTNTTGDPVFDETLRQGMAVQLEQSPFLNLISQGRIQHTLSLMGKPADARLTPEIAREVCERTASTAELEGSIASLGSQYVLGLRARECRSGDVLAEEQMQAARKEDVLNALSQLASRFRKRVGESLITVEKHNTPLAEATTPSLEALKAYSMGVQVVASRGEAAALPFFKQASEIDPNFALAYVRLGLMYGTLGESELGAESTAKAYELRDRASDEERFFIDASYDSRVTGNFEKAQQTCEAWAQAYPRALLAHLYLAGFIYPASGKYEKAVEESRKAIEIDPDFAVGYTLLAGNSVELDRFKDGEDALRRAADRNLDTPEDMVQSFDLAFLNGDKAEMARELGLAAGKSGADYWMSDHEAFVLAYSGHLQEAKRMSQHSADLANQLSLRERAALSNAGIAIVEALFGESSAAKRDALQATPFTKNREVEYGVGLALSLAGDPLQAQKLTDDLEQRYPQDTAVRFSYLPTLHAVLAMDRGDPLKAIESLQIAAPFELGTQRSTFHGNFGALYPIYMRGNAYLANHQGIQAIAEFQRVLSHRGIVVSDPIGALARLQLGRAYALNGDNAKAKASYQEFLVLWHDAEPDIPLLKIAKAEYANLK